MESAFSQLERTGGNNLDCIVNLLQISNLLDESTRSEVIDMFDAASDSSSVGYDQFQSVIYKVAAGSNQDYRQVATKVANAYASYNPCRSNVKYVTKKVGKQFSKATADDTCKQIEMIYNNLKKECKNNVDDIIELCKTAKLIDDSKMSQCKIMEMFDDVSDPNNVGCNTFASVINELAKEKAKKLIIKKITKAVFNDCEPEIACKGRMGSDMEQLEIYYNKLKCDCRNSVDGIIDVFVSSRVIDCSSESIANVTSMFGNVRDDTDVPFDVFCHVIVCLAQSRSQSILLKALKLMNTPISNGASMSGLKTKVVGTNSRCT